MTSCNSYDSLVIGQLVVCTGCGFWTGAGDSPCSAMMMMLSYLETSDCKICLHLLTRSVSCCCCTVAMITTACDENTGK